MTHSCVVAVTGLDADNPSQYLLVRVAVPT